MSSSYLLDSFVITLLIEKGKSFLDIGCGKGKWGCLINTSHKPSSFMIRGDINIENIAYVKKHRIYDDALLFDGRYLPFRDASFDIVLVFEVIEHMQEPDGYKLLDEAERVCKEKVIISTPLLGARYWYSEKEHVSRWTVSMLRKRGYTVRGVGFSFFGRFTTYRLAIALAPLAYYLPWISYILLAWKTPSKTQNEDSTGN